LIGSWSPTLGTYLHRTSSPERLLNHWRWGQYAVRSVGNQLLNYDAQGPRKTKTSTTLRKQPGIMLLTTNAY